MILVVYLAREQAQQADHGNLRMRGGLGGANGSIDHAYDLAHRGGWFKAEGAHHIYELDYAQAALPTLVFGNERLRLRQALGQLRLGQALTLSDFT
jgi:hypothetical protein